MDSNALQDTTVSVDDGDRAGHIEAMNESDTLEGISSSKEVIQELESDFVRLELVLACCSEKLFNISLLMMYVAAREGDFEAFASEKEEKSVDSAVKALELDVLFGIFDSEVREMDKFIDQLQADIKNACEIIPSHKHLVQAFSALEDRLLYAEKSMIQLKVQVAELMTQAAKFRRILSSFNTVERDGDKNAVILKDGNQLNANSNVKMHSYQQHRDTLRMLEKSLERELDLEKKLIECKHSLNEMKVRLCSSSQEVLTLEEETTAVYAQFLEADNSSTVLKGVLKELIGQLQTCQLNISSAMQLESELKSRLQNYTQAFERLEKGGNVKQQPMEENSSEVLMLAEKVNSLEEQPKGSESSSLSGNADLVSNSEKPKMKKLEKKMTIAEMRAEKAEAKCKLLEETNKELNEELELLRSSGISREKVDSLEKQLMETNIQLNQVMASVEVSQEKQSMLYSSIEDRNILIENLKLKVSKADARADDAEDKLIILSENNAELKEELNFLQGKLGHLEASLQQVEETKLATAKDLNVRAKVITDLVVQLAIEREQLQKQISFLIKENRALVHKLDMSNQAMSNSKNCEEGQKEKGLPISQCHAASLDRGGEIREVFCDATEKYITALQRG